MNGTINYKLGLNNASFMSSLRGAMTGLAGLTGAALSVGAVVRGVWKAIEEGGALQDLSNRTGEGVASLYQLRAAFMDVGASAEGLPVFLLNLQRALGGADESGKSTADALAKLGIVMGGLSEITPTKLAKTPRAGAIERLNDVGNVKLKINLKDFKALDAAKQIEVLAGSLAKLEKSESSAVASKLFGRGFGDIKAIVNDFEGFQRVLRDTAEEAQYVARSAAAFDRLGDSFVALRRKVGLIFTGIAEALAPTLQSIADRINSIDFAAIGQNFGRVISGIIGAIKACRFGEMISLSITAGLQTSIQAFAVFSQAAAQMLITALSSPAIGKALTAGLASVGSSMLGVAGDIGAFATAASRYLTEVVPVPMAERRPGQDYASLYTEETDKVAANTSARRGPISEAAKEVGAEIQKLAETLGKLATTAFAKLPATLNTAAGEALKKMFAELSTQFSGIPLGAKKNVAATDGSFKKIPQGADGHEVDRMTRIGFFSATKTQNTDYAQRTASNTARIANLAEAYYKDWRRSPRSANTSWDYAHV